MATFVSLIWFEGCTDRTNYQHFPLGRDSRSKYLLDGHDGQKLVEVVSLGAEKVESAGWVVGCGFNWRHSIWAIGLA